MDVLADDLKECKLIPCIVCNMFLLTTQEQFVWLKKQNPGGTVLSDCINMTFPSCIEKGQLKQEIEQLKLEIRYLNERVSFLRGIREDEDLIDLSINQLTDQFKSLHVNHEVSDSIVVDSCAQNVTVTDGTDNIESDVWLDASQTLNVSTIADGTIISEQDTNNTSVWADTTNIFEDILTGLLQRNCKEKSSLPCPSISDVSENVIAASDDDTAGRSEGSNSQDTLDCLHVPGVEGFPTSYGSAPALSQNDGENAIVIDLNDTLAPGVHTDHGLCVSPKIKLLVIGDESLTSFNVGSIDGYSSEDMFKIACPNALLCDLVDTANFFLDRFQDVETLVFHGGTTAMRRGRTEAIKNLYKTLIHGTSLKGINIVLSGPFPNPFMSSETFSRTAIVNRWLSNIDCVHVSVANHFTDFWNKPDMFYSLSYKLSDKGAAQLVSNIKRCVL